jgi:hypothetical protein
VPNDPTADPTPADQVLAVVAEQVLAEYPEDEQGTMLRSTGLRTSGKFYAFATATDLVVKLPAARVTELVASGLGMPCAPRPDRPMREWVQIPTPDEDTCRAYVLQARAFVAGTERSS